MKIKSIGWQSGVQMNQIILFVLLLFTLISTPAIAEISASYQESVVNGCIQGLLKKAIHDYSKMTGVNPENIPAEIQTRIEGALQPLYDKCTCLAQKTSAKVESIAENKMEVSVNFSGLSNATECTPEIETSSKVMRNLMRVVETSPPSKISLKTKRHQFSVDFKVNNARPSLFAAYTRPPESLTRLVFFSPGTGMASNPRDLYTDKSTLEITKAKDMFASYGRVLGKEGSQNLQKIIDQYGEDSNIITSGHNFTNFVPTQQKGVFAYPIQFINGVPVERTTEKSLWLVFFASQEPANPRAIDFTPAIASIVEVEFED